MAFVLIPSLYIFLMAAMALNSPLWSTVLLPTFRFP